MLLLFNLPTYPSTMLTSMLTAMAMTKTTGQKYVPYTVDQQLHKVAVDIVFNDLERCKDFTPILGGMHFLEEEKNQCYMGI